MTLALFFGAVAGAAEDSAGAALASDPSKLIEDCAQRMLKDLDAHRAEYRKDPSKIHKLVDEVLLPHFDTQYAARLVLGKHWREASQDQRQRFIDAFYQSLVENYGAALAEFTADRMRVLPFQGDPAAQQATVRTEVKRSDGTRVPVNYTMRKTGEGWKAWDVTIEGISYVKNFRTQYGAEIDQKGMEAVIKRLETEGVKTAPAASKQTST
jgi:phospholipid transport system substrate-binding protein